MSLRARLLTGIVLVVAALALTSVAVTYVQRDYLIDQLDDQLRVVASRAERVAAALRLRPGESLLRAPVTEAYLGRLAPDGSLSALAPPSDDPDLAPDVDAATAVGVPTTVDTRSGRADRMRVLLVPLADGGTGVVGLSTARAEQASRRLGYTMAGAAAAVLAVLGLVGWWVMRLGLRPIRQMTEAADAIAEGDLDRRVGPFPDGTEAARLATAFNLMVETRQGAEERLRRFVADASHELRTPLTTLRGYAELHAAGRGDAGDVSDAMRRIHQEATRMSSLVDDLLLLANLDEGRPLARERVALAPILADLVADMRVLAPDREVTLNVPAGLYVTGDPQRLTQVLAALANNALRHTPAGTAVAVRAISKHGGVRAEVADCGPGIPADDIARIFDRFYRADASRSRAGGGNGLGLAIARSLVEAHGGRIGVESVAGQGSTFWAELPHCPGAPTRPTGESADQLESS